MGTLCSFAHTVLNNMLPILIFLASATLFARFGFLAWRSRLLALIEISLSPACQNMIARVTGSLVKEEFDKAALLLRICPSQPAGKATKLMVIRAYYNILRWSLWRLAAPAGSQKQSGELHRPTCVRHLALKLDQRLRNNPLQNPKMLEI